MWGIAMKKRTKNKAVADKQKNKLLRRLSISVVVIYITAMLALFSAYMDYNDSMYRLFTNSYVERCADLTNDGNNSDLTTENIVYFFHQSISDDFTAVVGLYTDEGVLVNITGDVIVFNYENEVRYLYIDKYLNAENTKILSELYDKYDDVYFGDIEFYEENGQIVPVCVNVCYEEYLFNEFEEGSLKLVLNDYDGKTFKISGMFSTVSLNHIFQNFEQKNLENLLEYVKGENAQLNIEYIIENKPNTTEYQSGICNYNDYLSDHYFPVTINGEQYYVVVASGYRPVCKALDDVWHSSQAYMLFVVIALLYHIFEHFLSEYYDKRKKLEENKTAFTSAAAHELKTPIAIIQNQCECIIENIAPEKNDEYVKSIYEETQKMSRLVSDLLNYNRLAQTEKLSVEKCDMKDIVESETEKYKQLFELHHKNVSVVFEEIPFVNCNREFIALVVDNFLSNAVKHSSDGGSIAVRLQKVGESKVKLSVFNTGEHIPEKIGAHVWDLLYKADESRGGSGRSSGVGLAISARILELHGAYYDYKNVDNGVIFSFII